MFVLNSTQPQTWNHHINKTSTGDEHDLQMSLPLESLIKVYEVVVWIREFTKLQIITAD